jgi:putative multiple sugar transport system permease protein
MKGAKGLFRINVRQYAMLIALVAIMAFFQVATRGVLFVPMNVTNLVLQNSYVFILAMSILPPVTRQIVILAIGMTICLVTGGNIDMSVGSLVAFVGATCGTLIVTMKLSVGLGIAAGIAVGLVFGLWQGFWIAYVRIPSFIVTLAGMLSLRGLTIFMLKGLTIGPFPESYQRISAGFVPDFLGRAVGAGADSSSADGGLNITAVAAGAVVAIIYTLAAARRRSARRRNGFDAAPAPAFIAQAAAISAILIFIAVWLALYKGLPIVFLIIAVLVAVYSFFMGRTVPGRYIYAMGGNEKAARLSGIDTNKVLFFSYVNMGVMAAIAGVVFSARLNAAAPGAGDSFALDAIAACFIGGASAYGGIGTIVGSIIGALVMGVLNNGMSFMGVGSDLQMLVKGLVLLLAVAFDVMSKKRAG